MDPGRTGPGLGGLDDAILGGTLQVAVRTRRFILLAVAGAAALAVTSLTAEPSSATTGPSFVQQVSARRAMRGVADA